MLLSSFHVITGKLTSKTLNNISLSLSLITDVTCGLEAHEEQVIRESHRCDQQVDPWTAGVRTVDNFVFYKEVPNTSYRSNSHSGYQGHQGKLTEALGLVNPT